MNAIPTLYLFSNLDVFYFHHLMQLHCVLCATYTSPSIHVQQYFVDVKHTQPTISSQQQLFIA
jgi:hypothetical protein